MSDTDEAKIELVLGVDKRVARLEQGWRILAEGHYPVTGGDSTSSYTLMYPPGPTTADVADALEADTRRKVAGGWLSETDASVELYDSAVAALRRATKIEEMARRLVQVPWSPPYRLEWSNIREELLQALEEGEA